MTTKSMNYPDLSVLWTRKKNYFKGHLGTIVELNMECRLDNSVLSLLNFVIVLLCKRIGRYSCS